VVAPAGSGFSAPPAKGYFGSRLQHRLGQLAEASM